jgi:hypothetical protein
MTKHGRAALFRLVFFSFSFCYHLIR